MATTNRTPHSQPAHTNLHASFAKLAVPAEEEMAGRSGRLYGLYDRSGGRLLTVRASVARLAVANRWADGRRMESEQVGWVNLGRAHGAQAGDGNLQQNMSADCKGVVMRLGALRADTAKAAARLGKMRTRLAAGEKPNRKRMACLIAVYDAEPLGGARTT